MAGGCTAIILLSKVDDTKLTKPKVIELLSTPQSIAFMVFSIVLMVMALYSFKVLVRSAKRFEKDMHDWLLRKVQGTANNKTLSFQGL